MLEGINYSDSRVLVEGAAGTGKTVLARFIAENHLLGDKKILWTLKQAASMRVD